MTPEQILALPYRPCVGVVLMNRDGLIFTGQRIDTPGAWQMPQGGIDAGETPREAALRELFEETGVLAEKAQLIAETEEWLHYDLPHDLVPKLWKGRFRGQTQKWVLMRFDGVDGDIDITQPPAEFSHWQWMPKEQLLEKIVPFKAELYSQVIAGFADQITAA